MEGSHGGLQWNMDLGKYAFCRHSYLILLDGNDRGVREISSRS